MHTYVKSEPQLWTVGRYTPGGEWVPLSDHDTENEAIRRVSTLNGSIVIPAENMVTVGPDEFLIILMPFDEEIEPLLEAMISMVGDRFVVLDSREVEIVKVPITAPNVGAVPPPLLVIGDPDDRSTWRYADSGEPFDFDDLNSTGHSGVLIVPPEILPGPTV